VSAQQLGLALLPHHVKAHFQQTFEPAFAEASKIIGFRFAGRMQRVTDGELYLGGIRIEDDLAQIIEFVGVGDAISQTQFLQHTVGPLEQALLAFGLGAGVFLGAGRRKRNDAR
jgi:hypothetical protein